jgi:hypothetical protein
VTEQITRTEERAANRVVRGVVRGAEKAVHKTFAAPAAAIDKGLSIAGKTAQKATKRRAGILKKLGDLLDFLAGGPPKDTPQQAHEKAQAAGNVGTVAAENAALNKEANDTARTDQIDQAELERQQREAELYTRLIFAPKAGGPACGKPTAVSS